MYYRWAYSIVTKPSYIPVLKITARPEYMCKPRMLLSKYGIPNVTKMSKVFLQVQTDLRAVFKSATVMLHLRSSV